MRLKSSSLNEDDLLLTKASFLMGLGIATLIYSLNSEPSWQGAFLVFVSFNLVFSFVIKFRDCIVLFIHGISLLVLFYLLQTSIVLEEKYIIGNVSSLSQAVNVLGVFPTSNYLIIFFGFVGYLLIFPIIYNLKENYRITLLMTFSIISATICSFVFFTIILPNYDVYQLTPVSSGSYIVTYFFYYFIIFFVVFIGYFAIETINEISSERSYRFNDSKSMNDTSDNSILMVDKLENMNQYNAEFKIELEKFLKTITPKLRIEGKIGHSDLIKRGLELFDYALEKGLNPEDMGYNKDLRSNSIILLYYSLISLGINRVGEDIISAAAIERAIQDGILKKKFQTGSLLKFLPEELADMRKKLPKILPKGTKIVIYDSDFKIQLERYITLILKTLSIESIINSTQIMELKSLSLLYFKEALKKNLSPDDMKPSKNAKAMAIILVYYAFNKVVRRITVIELVELFREILDISKNARITINKFYPFLPEDYGIPLKDLVRPYSDSFEDIKNYVESLGGILYTSKEVFIGMKNEKKIIPNLVPLEVYCPREHLFITNKNKLTQGYWCKSCSQSKSEKILKWYFEKIFSYITKKHIVFLPNHQLYKTLEISYKENYINEYIKHSHFDGYLKLGKIGLETRGIKVSEPSPRTNVKLYRFQSMEGEKFHKKLDLVKNEIFELDLFNNHDVILLELGIGKIFLQIKEIYNKRKSEVERKVILLNSELNNLKDITSHDLKLAYEYNGMQHYKFPNPHHKNFNNYLKGLMSDLLKKKIANDNNIFLITFPYFVSKRLRNPRLIQDFIIEELSNIVQIDLVLHDIPQFNHLFQGFYEYDLGTVYKVKNYWSEDEILKIKENSKRKNKVAILDIETTGVARDDCIIEIGVVELDLRNGNLKVLFNSVVKESKFDLKTHHKRFGFKKTGISPEIIDGAESLSKFEEILRLIFENYRVGSWSKTGFDYKWIESRGYNFPFKFDIQNSARRLIAKKYSIKQFTLRSAWSILLDSDENKLLNKYINQGDGNVFHRAIYDAAIEAKILYLLIKKFGYKIQIQRQLS